MQASNISQQIKILSVSFLLIFFGFSSVQQFITPYYSGLGIPNVGFQSLILIYSFFLLSGPFSAVFVSKYGPKKCMFFASLVYGIFIFTITAGVPLIYFSSFLLGISASLLWTGQNSYLIMASNEKSYGASSGLFMTFSNFGSAAGILILSYLISRFSFESAFMLYTFFPFAGCLLLSRLKDLKAEREISQFRLLRKAIANPLAIRLSVFYIAFLFIFGLTIGTIPIEIKNRLSIGWVGGLSSVFWIIPIVFSYILGKLSDIKGRRVMIITAYMIGIGGLILLFFQQAPALIFGILLLAIAYAIFKTMSLAFVGDVAKKENLVSLSALFWMAQNVGTILALFVSKQLQANTAYLIAISILVASLIIQLPLLRLDTKEIKERLS